MTEPWTPEDVRRMAEVDAHYLLCPSTPEMCDRCKYALQRAEDRLAALAEAGRLREPGGEWQWGYRCAISSCKEPHVVQGERSARSLAGRAVAGASAVRRWVGPWLPADPAPAVSPVTEENPNG